MAMSRARDNTIKADSSLPTVIRVNARQLLPPQEAPLRVGKTKLGAKERREGVATYSPGVRDRGATWASDPAPTERG